MSSRNNRVKQEYPRLQLWAEKRDTAKWLTNGQSEHGWTAVRRHSPKRKISCGTWFEYSVWEDRICIGLYISLKFHHPSMHKRNTFQISKQVEMNSVILIKYLQWSIAASANSHSCIVSNWPGDQCRGSLSRVRIWHSISSLETFICFLTGRPTAIQYRHDGARLPTQFEDNAAL
jgi:hypothetical protein